MEYDIKKLQQTKIILAIAVVVILAAIIAIPIIRYFTTPTLASFNFAPTTATIELDGQTYGVGVSELPAKTYTATVTAPGFQDTQITFSLQDHTTTPVQIYLPCEDGTMDCYKKDTASLVALRSFTFAEPDQFFAAFMNQYRRAEDELQTLPIYEYYSGNNASEASSVTGLPATIIKDGSSRAECPTGGLCILVSGSRRTSEDLAKVFSKYDLDQDFYYIIYDWTGSSAVAPNDDSNDIYHYLPYDDYASGFKATINESSTATNIIIDVKFYTCLENLLPAMKERFVNWLTSLSLDADDYQINYLPCD